MTHGAAGFTVRLGSWPDLAPDAGAIRDEVFVVEQGVPAAIEHDANDVHCLHVLASSAAGVAVGTGRLLPDGHVGRMAVRAAWRGHGVGRMMLEVLIGAARQRGDREVVLNSQATAIGFYERMGFEAIGPRFHEAGIEHQAMRLPLDI